MIYRASLKYLPLHPYYVTSGRIPYLGKRSRDIIEKRYMDEKRKQPGIAFPSATNQEHIFIVRFDISDSLSGTGERDKEVIRTGLKSLCKLFDNIAGDEMKINVLSDDG